ncbi:MAG: SMODS domain-containing nucleotidyltransferase [Gelidibacter sp.]
MNKAEYLSEVLETHRMSKIEDLVSKFKSKRDEVKSALLENYGSEIYSPFDSGSFKKHTAINIKFDLDIVVPFKKDSSETLENMFDNLYDFLYEKYKDEAYIRKQKVSIGIEFNEDEDGDIVSLDVVPGRELNQDQYIEDKNLNLYVYSQYGFFQKSTYIQTNIHSQIDHIKAKDDERKVIRLFKIWKNSNNEKYKSFLLELMTIKAFDKEDVSGNVWEKIKKVMEYVRDNVEKEDFKLIDPGNSNNNVIDTLENWERSNLSSRMQTIISRIEENSENLKTYFPVNSDFENNSSDNSSYGIKGSTVTASIPPTNQRFG